MNFCKLMLRKTLNYHQCKLGPNIHAQYFKLEYKPLLLKKKKKSKNLDPAYTEKKQNTYAKEKNCPNTY